MLEGTKLVTKDVAELKEPGTESDFCPDLALYPNDEQAKQAYEFPHVERSTADAARKPHLAYTAWAWMGLPVEVKVKDSAFKFDAKKPTALRNLSGKGPAARVQHAGQVAEIFLRQQRTHVFSVYVLRSRVRLLRWDRTGILVTEWFDAVAEPEKLLDFIYRIGRVSEQQFGYDGSAERASEHDMRVLQDYAGTVKNEWEQSMLEEMLNDVVHYPILKVRYYQDPR